MNKKSLMYIDSEHKFQMVRLNADRKSQINSSYKLGLLGHAI
jgi:hypothetical protein